ncbi:MAG TPA: 30S ribosomal protein S4 [Candidatus Paceibacterota bacterium]|nr:30S ribosomal protein S4 [Candidatus Paceibacterota bacterium]
MLQIKSKYKIAKRLGAAVFEQTQSQRYALSEARTQKAKRRRRNPSDYSRQLTEKQKVRYTYGLSEHQFARYVKEAMAKADPMAALYKTLESRLDNVAYRLGLAPTRRAARQMASHGHFLVNGTRMTVPSHQMEPGDVLAIREGSKESPLFAKKGEGEEGQGGYRPAPAWAAFDFGSMTGSITGVPQFVPGEGLLDFQVVFEYYSR